MEYKEEKIATYTEGKTRIQLLKMTENWEPSIEGAEDLINIKYQIRINRKRVYNTGYQYDARKYFATIIQNTILQLKIY